MILRKVCFPADFADGRRFKYYILCENLRNLRDTFELLTDTFLFLLNTCVTSVPNSEFLILIFLVRVEGVEPTRLSTPDSKSGASASFATPALTIFSLK